MDYPNSGEAYSSDPRVTTEAEQVDTAKVASGAPIMDDLTAWFDEQIADSDSLMNIEITELTVNGVKYSRKVSIEAQVLAHQLVKGILEAKKQQYETFKGQL